MTLHVASNYITLNKKQYRANMKTLLALKTEIQQYPVESGFSVADNVRHKPPAFDLEFTLGGATTTGGRDKNTEYLELKALRDAGTPFYFVSDFGAFENMIITAISPAQELSSNTYSCTVSITQIRYATLATKAFNVIDKDGRVIYAEATPGGIPATQALREVESALSETFDPPYDGISWVTSLLRATFNR